MPSDGKLPADEGPSPFRHKRPALLYRIRCHEGSALLAWQHAMKGAYDFMQTKKFDAKLICYLALLAAMYVLLGSYLVIRHPAIEISFKSLPVVVGALLFGPASGALIALLGEFLAQLLAWGLQPNTILWVVPPVANGFVVGWIASLCWKNGKFLESRGAWCYGAALLGSFATSCVTTVSLWLDSLLYGYYTFALVFGGALLRFGKDIIVAAVITTAAIPLTQLLRWAGLTALGRSGK